MTPLKVAILADYLEEGWPSMDLVAGMLHAELAWSHEETVAVTLVRPVLRRRFRAMSDSPRLATLDRVVGRVHDYPRHLRRVNAQDIYHVIDHSYAHLVLGLPAARTVVTCHDADAFRCLTDPDQERRSALFRAMARRVLAGLKTAAHIACTTEATRQTLVARLGVDPARATVVHNGVDPLCFGQPTDADTARAERLLGPAGASCDLLHVGSTIPRKRIEDLLRIVAAVAARKPRMRLVRVGGAFTAGQAELARELRVDLEVLPFLERGVLAAIYRRSALLLLPSEREGFGLPLVEALASGVPAIASDIPALREVGAEGAEYCPVGDIPAWAAAVGRLLDERANDETAWTARKTRAVARARSFSWASYAQQMVGIYRRLAGVAGVAC